MKVKHNKMIRHYSFLLVVGSMLLVSCFKDKGNYDIALPAEPVISNLDTVYTAYVGDSLIIEPRVTAPAGADIEFEWRIMVPESISDTLYRFTGPSLRIIFGLQSRRYRTKLTLHNKTNGMKYFHWFEIQGVTEFTRGTTVLSIENGTTQFSFVKPDGTVQARVYEAINNKILPDNPLHLFYLTNQFTSNTPLGYWIITKNGGVRLNVSTLMEDAINPNTLKDNFFTPPSVIEVGSLQKNPEGVMVGVINGKFYGGATTTWDQSPTYGMFGGFANGEYELDPHFIMTNINNNITYIAFEKNKKQFIRINSYGVPTYFGTDYTVVNRSVFDPTSVGMDLTEMVQINSTDTYAYCRDNTGVMQELMFNVNFGGPFTFTARHKRPFIRQELFTDKTKLIATRSGAIYIASGTAIYRYNPLNEELRTLNTAFNSDITMLKLSEDENTLIVGTANSLVYLNISVGNYGDLVSRVDGIPGAPIDIQIRN